MAGTLLLGRARERAMLTAAWERARSGSTAVVLIGGTAGVGKTSLVADFAAECSSDGATVLSGGCDADAIVPMQAFTEALRGYIDDAPLSTLRTFVGRYGAEIVRVAPRLAERLPDLPPPAPIDPEADRLRVVSGVWGLVRVAADEGPVLIVVEDLHWATELTMFAFRQVLRNIMDQPVLLVGTFRDDEVANNRHLRTSLADLRNERGVERVTVVALPESAIGELAAARLCTSVERLGDVTSKLFERAHGNPLFTVHLIDHLLETEQLATTATGWRVSPDRASELPGAVQALLGRRLDQLDDRASGTLSHAAVRGMHIDLDLLEAIPSVGSVALDGLEAAIAAGFVVEDGRTRGGFRFTHAVARQAVLDRLTPTRRVLHHAHVGAAIERVHAADLGGWIGELAHHYLEAVPVVPARLAASRALEAARSAIEAYDVDAATLLCERAIAVLSDDDPRLRVELLAVLGNAAFRRGDLGEMRRVGALAAEEAAALGEWTVLADAVRTMASMIHSEREAELVTKLANAALDGLAGSDRAREAMMLAALGIASGIGYGVHVDVDAVSARAVEIAVELDEPAALVDAVVARLIALGCDDRAEQIRLCEQLLATSVRAGDLRGQAQGHRWSIAARLSMADRTGALAGIAEVERLGDLMHGEFWSSLVVAWRVTLALLDGELDRAQQLCVELAGSGSAGAYAAGAHMFWLRAEQGRLAEAMPLLEVVMAQRPSQPLGRVALAYAEAATGDLDAASGRLDALAANDFGSLAPGTMLDLLLVLLAETTARTGSTDHATVLRRLLSHYEGQLCAIYQVGACVGAVDRFLGMLAAMEGDVAEVDRLFASALRLEAEVGSPPLQARTRYWWAWALLRGGDTQDRDRAIELLRECEDTAVALDMHGLVADAVGLRAKVAQ